MTDEMRCRWRGSELPRGVVGRHEGGCEDEDCKGCEPCGQAHCRCCGVRHDEGACADCLAAVRESISEIERMCDALPGEVRHHGVDGEAMMLLAPPANPEARGHLEASVAAGRVSRDVIQTEHAKDCEDPTTCLGCAHQYSPLWVAGTWAMVYRDAFEHDEPIGRVHLGTELGYLRRNLTEAAVFPWVPFEDLASDLRRCVAHLERVLHDEERGERANVACFDCGGDLERKLGARGFDDRWTCRGRGCGRRYTIAEYNFALRAALEESA